MNKTGKRIGIALLFLVTMLGIAFWANDIEISRSQENAILSIVLYKTRGYKIRQILSIMLLYLYGELFLRCICVSMSSKLRTILAFPVSLCVWCALSYCVLFFHIPYRASIMGIAAVLLLSVLAVMNRSKLKEIDIFSAVIKCMYVFGVACVVTTGVFFIHLTEDSYYFISQYAEIITKWEGLNPGYCGLYMTWTGIAPALMNSLAIMGGYETIYGIHHVLMLSFLAFFGYSVWEICKGKFNKKKCFLISGGATVLLVITPAVGFTLGLELSSSYFMVFIFMLVILAQKMVEIADRADFETVIQLLVIMLVLTRQESSVVLCFFILYFSTLGYDRKTLLRVFVLPCVLTQVVYLVNIYLNLSVGSDEAIVLNVKTTCLIMAVNLMTLIYIAFIYNNFFKIIQKYMCLSLFVGLLLTQLVLFLVETEKMRTNMIAELRNVSNSDWGFSFWIVLLLLMFSILLDGKLSNPELLWVEYLMFYFVICAGRSYDLRYGITDSYARMMVSSIPLAYYAFLLKLSNWQEQKRINV